MWSRRQGWRERAFGEHDPRGSAGERPPTPPPPTQQALQVLPSRHEHGLAVDLLQSSESEATESMPVLGLGEERFYPHLAFPHGLGGGLGVVVAAHPITVG